jgi:hypothetical protein
LLYASFVSYINIIGTSWHLPIYNSFFSGLKKNYNWYNTIEGKQFWLSLKSALYYLKQSQKRDFVPKYEMILRISVNQDCISKLNLEYLDLDGNKAIHIPNDMLENFNNCINFVKENGTGNYI